MHPSKAVRIGSAPEGSRTIVAAAHVVDQPEIGCFSLTDCGPSRSRSTVGHGLPAKVTYRVTLRYEILKRAKFRCELCGISADEKALEVDHIVPRNRGGADDLPNLQALCYSCNAMKRDRDEVDFRGIAATSSTAMFT
jgi:hypothetical protein